jgi:hypothetical protein
MARSSLPSRRQLATFGGYLVAAAVYVGIGLYEVDFLLSYWVAVAYVLLVGWLVPAAVKRVFSGHFRPEGREVA